MQSGPKLKRKKSLDHLNEMSAHSYIAPYNVGLIYAGLGEKEVAFDWLNRAYNARSYLLAEYLNTDPHLDGLRSDSRFSDLHRRVGLPAPETP